MRIKRQLDDPRALRDPASGAVIFAFGASGPEARRLPGPALVAILGALGMTEGTARAALLRMRRGGWLASNRRGPVVEYALTAPASALAASITAPLMLPRMRWAGSFQGLLFSVSELERGYRDALRRAATLAGFGLLQPGLLIVIDPRRWSRIEPLLAQAPSSSRLYRAELHMALDEARLAASEAWPLGSLAIAYRRQAAELMQTVAPYRSDPPDGAAAVRILWEAMRPISATAIEDPALPSVLLPTDWPGTEIQASIAAAGMVLGPPVQAFIDESVALSVRRH